MLFKTHDSYGHVRGLRYRNGITLVRKPYLLCVRSRKEIKNTKRYSDNIRCFIISISKCNKEGTQWIHSIIAC